MTHLLEVRGLTVDFLSEGAPVRATDNVSWHVDKGETLAILGESGSGKSVSVSAVMGLIDTPPGDICGGQMLYQGRDITNLSRSERRDLSGQKISMIFQDPLAHLNPVQSIGQQVIEVYEEHGTARGRAARAKAVEVLERVGIPDAARRIDQYPHQFSGGQRQRIMIAMALALEPELLIADEPTTALDVSVQAQILDLLRELQRETGMGMILITHDLEVAASMADRIVVMQGGKIVESGTAQQVFETPQNAYTRMLLAALPHAQDASSDNKRADKAATEPLLSVKGLRKDYGLSLGLFARKSLIHAVRDVSFHVNVGETVGIVGESGSGKSSLARLLMRLETVSGGEAYLRGEDILAMKAGQLSNYRRKVQMVFQDPYGSLNPLMTIMEVISEPWQINRDLLPRDHWRDRVVELLELVGLSAAHSLRHPHQLSGGQRQRVAIARALASDPELLICDEAVSALDVSVQAQVIDLLADLRDKLGLSYIFITHDLPIARHFADRIIVMKNGEIVEENGTDALFAQPAHPYTRSLLASVPIPKWQQAHDPVHA